jgi:ubiquinone/menaquinone biosynthesis C-methylase UbiE
LLGERIYDFHHGDWSAAEQILDWPVDFAPRAGRDLRAIRRGEPLTEQAVHELKTAGLVDEARQATELGTKLLYHLDEYQRQAAADGIPQALLDRTDLGAGARVLDLGCGAGQTLRLLGQRRPALGELVGLDSDAEVLAIGCRLADAAGQRIRFVRGVAPTLPFRDHSFSHVLCRGTVNYLHQGQTLRETARVLEPGGLLYCRAEGPGYDLYRLAGARSARAVASFLSDFLLGVVLVLTGCQGTPGRRATGGRAFTTVGRLTRMLRRLDCEIILSNRGRRYLGLPGWVEILARKGG